MCVCVCVCVWACMRACVCVAPALWLVEKKCLWPLYKSVCFTAPQNITDEDLDGKAIAIGISTSPGPDWLKDVVRKVGLRLKVHKELRQLLLTSSSRIQRGNEPVSPPMFSPPASAQHTRSLSPFSGSVSRNVCLKYM